VEIKCIVCNHDSKHYEINMKNDELSWFAKKTGVKYFRPIELWQVDVRRRNRS
jgi:hypothetical protein